MFIEGGSKTDQTVLSLTGDFDLNDFNPNR
jgi:hypothetical protein